MRRRKGNVMTLLVEAEEGVVVVGCTWLEMDEDEDVKWGKMV